MLENITYLVLLSPLAFVITAIVSWFQPGPKPVFVKKTAMIASLLSICISIIIITLLNSKSLLEIDILSINNLGISLRLDSLSILMLNMIALLSFIIIKFSGNYLDGDDRQGAFIGRLAATIGSVQLLVLSGNLAILFISWVLTSISLHRLLVFYPNRPGAIISARKKFILARLSDTFLLAAVILLYNEFHTGNLEAIFSAIKITYNSNSSTTTLEYAALALAFAAIIKSAQFPFHGWIVEVMETPTPVSALLHAGLLNAGPFLIVRMAFIINESNYTQTLLIITGAFTALFASIVYLTQTSVKTALGYSSVAHMGFSLLTCGLGVYSATMLHLVAHSFYKAHAFLSSGSAIEVVRSSKFSPLKRLGHPARIFIGFVLSIIIYFTCAAIWGVNPSKQLPLLAIGMIILFGLTKILTEAIDSNGSPSLIIKATILAIVVTVAFFTLESLSHSFLSTQLPETSTLSNSEIIITIIIVLIFTTTIFIQIIAPLTSKKSLFSTIIIHLRNGLYVNSYFDRLVGALKIESKNIN